MKKRRILLGLALAAAAVFSLSACGEDETTTTPTQDTGENQVTKYTIKFMNGTTEVETKQIDKDTVITAPTAPTKAEDVSATYTFKGWYTAQTGGTKLTDTTKATADATYYAQFESTPKKYAITFIVGENTVETKNINYNEVITAPEDPTKDSDNENNYVFAGWFTAATGGTELTSTTKVSGAATYYAQFTAVAREYSVIFMVGTSEYDKQSLAYNAQIVAPTTNPTKAEDDDYTYTFDGWYTAQTGGTKVTEFGTVTETPTVYYARFIAHQKVAVTFMNGTTVVDEQYLAEGTQIVAPADPVKAEDNIATYVFDGWYTEATGGTKVTEFGTATEDVTYYAHFNATVKEYDVKFFNGEEEITTLSAKIKANTEVTKPTANLPEVTGKRFEYWTSNTTTNIPYDFSTKITAAVNLYAVFVDADEYDTLANSTTNLFATTFYNETIDTSTTAFDSETVALRGTDGLVNITTSNNVALSGTANTSFVVDLGNKKITDSALTTVYATVVFDGVANGEAFMQIDGNSATTSGKEVFGLRTKKDERTGSATNGAIVFAYRLDGQTDILSHIKAEASKSYNIKIVLDTALGVAEVYINGEKVEFADTATDISLSNQISKINGVKFTSKSGTGKTIDNVLINSEAKAKSEIVTAKENALAAADTYKNSDGYKALEAVVKTEVDNIIAEYIKNVSAAQTVEEVADLVTDFSTFTTQDKFAVAVKAYSAANTPVEGMADQYIVSVNGETNFAKQFVAIAFSGYELKGIYVDAELTTAATNADVVKGATFYASVEKKSIETINFAGVQADGWTVTSGASFKTNTKDGATGSTTEYNVVQCQPKSADSKTGELIYTLADNIASTSVDISLKGWTTKGSSAEDILLITVYDKTGNVITTKKMYTTAGKACGSYTVDSAGTETVLTINTGETEIGKISFTCSVDTKSVFITEIELDIAL